MSIPLASLGPSAYWYLTRGTGAVALLLLTASVVLGMLGPLRFAAARWPRFAVDTLHRDISLLVIVLLLVHIVTSVLDSFAPISLSDAVVPFASSYRPLWLGLGALSFDILLALVVTSLLRRRLGYGRWRAIHWLAYASWPVAVLHGLGTGSDTKAGWMLALTGACTVAVLGAVCVRIARAAPERPAVRLPATALSIVTPLGLAVFTLAGPLESGWAARAGTPAKLLGKKAHVPAAPVATPVDAIAVRIERDNQHRRSRGVLGRAQRQRPLDGRAGRSRGRPVDEAGRRSPRPAACPLGGSPDRGRRPVADRQPGRPDRQRAALSDGGPDRARCRARRSRPACAGHPARLWPSAPGCTSTPRPTR